MFENVSQRISFEQLSAKTYLDFCDILFPKPDEPRDSQKISLMISATSAIQYPENGIFLRLCLAPWFLQGQEVSAWKGWSPDNTINATACESVDRIQLALNSFYTIATISAIVLAWCLVRLMQSFVYAKPLLSPFSEINVVEMILGGSENGNIGGISELFGRSSTIDASKIGQKLYTTRIYIRPALENEENSYEITTLRQE